MLLEKLLYLPQMLVKLLLLLLVVVHVRVKHHACLRFSEQQPYSEKKVRPGS